MKIVRVIERANGQPQIAAVRDERATVEVVAQRVIDGNPDELAWSDWEPLYALKPDGTREPLPACFRLNRDCYEALEETP